MIKIGDLVIPNRVFAAPMAGVTDKAFRILARECGAGLVCTEMINDMGLLYKQARTERLADIKGEQPPVAIQIFGSAPENMGQAAQIAENMGAGMININMGCPTPKIIKNGSGAALMLDLQRSREIIRSVARAVKIPVTIKIRSGWDSDRLTFMEMGAIAEEEGAKAVILHPRTRTQFYSGQADWRHIALLKKNLSIPVVGNGDITSHGEAVRMFEETACDAIMIGRAAMGNPFIFQQTVQILEKGGDVAIPSPAQRMAMARRQLALAVIFKGETTAVKEMRKHLAWYTKGMPGAARVRTGINQAVSSRELLNIMEEIGIKHQ